MPKTTNANSTIASNDVNNAISEIVLFMSEQVRQQMDLIGIDVNTLSFMGITKLLNLKNLNLKLLLDQTYLQIDKVATECIANESDGAQTYTNEDKQEIKLQVVEAIIRYFDEHSSFDWMKLKFLNTYFSLNTSHFPAEIIANTAILLPDQSLDKNADIRKRAKKALDVLLATSPIAIEIKKAQEQQLLQEQLQENQEAERTLKAASAKRQEAAGIQQAQNTVRPKEPRLAEGLKPQQQELTKLTPDISETAQPVVAKREASQVEAQPEQTESVAFEQVRTEIKQPLPEPQTAPIAKSAAPIKKRSLTRVATIAAMFINRKRKAKGDIKESVLQMAPEVVDPEPRQVAEHAIAAQQQQAQEAIIKQQFFATTQNLLDMAGLHDQAINELLVMFPLHSPPTKCWGMAARIKTIKTTIENLMPANMHDLINKSEKLLPALTQELLNIGVEIEAQVKAQIKTQTKETGDFLVAAETTAATVQTTQVEVQPPVQAEQEALSIIESLAHQELNESPATISTEQQPCAENEAEIEPENIAEQQSCLNSFLQNFLALARRLISNLSKLFNYLKQCFGGGSKETMPQDLQANKAYLPAHNAKLCQAARKADAGKQPLKKTSRPEL